MALVLVALIVGAVILLLAWSERRQARLGDRVQRWQDRAQAYENQRDIGQRALLGIERELDLADQVGAEPDLIVLRQILTTYRTSMTHNSKES